MRRRTKDRQDPPKPRQGADVWPDRADGRPRVLVEYPPAGTPTVLADVLERAGFDTMVCDRPADDPESCRLLQAGSCDLAAGADVIFNGFGLAEPEHQEIIDRLRATHPDTPLVVEATRPRAEANADLLEGCVLCDSPLRARALLEAVRQAAVDDGTQPTLAS